MLKHHPKLKEKWDKIVFRKDRATLDKRYKVTKEFMKELEELVKFAVKNPISKQE